MSFIFAPAAMLHNLFHIGVMIDIISNEKSLMKHEQNTFDFQRDRNSKVKEK